MYNGTVDENGAPIATVAYKRVAVYYDEEGFFCKRSVQVGWSEPMPLTTDTPSKIVVPKERALLVGYHQGEDGAWYPNVCNESDK